MRVPLFLLVTMMTAKNLKCLPVLKLVHTDNLHVLCVEQAVQNAGPDDVESNSPVSSHISSMRRFMKLMMSQIFAQSCVLTFLAEWGDRSQISTIILAARDVSLATGFQLLQ